LRPLPDLSDLSVPDSVLDPVADDFSQLLADQPQSLDSLQLLLDPPADQALADLGILSDAIDALGAFSDGVDATYGQLHTAIADLDYSQTIATVQALEQNFYDSQDSFQVDYGTLAFDLLKSVFDVIVAAVKDILAAIIAAINAIIRFLASLGSSLLFGPPGAVWSGGNFPAPPPVPSG
jgi:hypothetical protein